MLRAEFLLGLSRRNENQVSPQEFDDFLDQSVTRRFPDGLTTIDAAGRWRSPDGRMVQESSKVLLIVTPSTPDARTKLEQIRADYRSRFHQQSVILLLTEACGSY